MCSRGWSCSIVCCISFELGSWYGPKRTGSDRSYGLARNQIFRCMTNVRSSCIRRHRHIDNTTKINRICGIFAGVFIAFWLCCTGHKSCTGSVWFGLEILLMP